jgi:hypothetical protein
MELMNKKGFFFTLTVILIFGIFLASFSLYDEIQDRKAIQKRVDTMNGYLFSLEEDLSRQLYISGYRIIFLAMSEIYSPPAGYIADMNLFFEDAIDDGIMQSLGETGPARNPILNEFTKDDIVNEMKTNAKEIGTRVELGDPDVTLSQDDPWHIKITMKVDLLFEDESGIAKWNKKDHEIVAYIPITEFEDPIYYVGSSGNMVNKIVRSETCDATSCDLENHVLSKEYVENPNAPSFLKRLQGDFSSDPNGIESIVYMPQLELALGPGNTYNDRSIVDYKYFGDVSEVVTYTGTSPYPSWLKFDSGDESYYNP